MEWRVEDWLDEGHPNEPSPDVILTDGCESVAVEIKQLTDGDTFRPHRNSLRSLDNQLALDSPHNYVVIQQPFLVLPRDYQWIKKSKLRSAAAALELRVGESAIVPVRRRATVRFLDGFDRGLVVCQHQRSDEVIALSGEVDGCYLLQDAGEPEHQFLTEETHSAFKQRLRKACEASRRNGEATIEWSEEWELQRVSDSSEGVGRVSVIVPVADFEEAAAIESVKKEINSARRKFESKDWAKRNAVALHAGQQQSVIAPSLFESAIERMDAVEVKPLDSVFLVAGTRVRQFDFRRTVSHP